MGKYIQPTGFMNKPKHEGQSKHSCREGNKLVKAANFSSMTIFYKDFKLTAHTHFCLSNQVNIDNSKRKMVALETGPFQTDHFPFPSELESFRTASQAYNAACYSVQLHVLE